MKRAALLLWAVLSLSLSALALPPAARAWEHDIDGYGTALALLLWAISVTNAAVGGSCLGAAMWPRKS